MRHQRTSLASTQQHGYSIAEVLVAMAVFTVIILAALLLYDRSNKAFTQSMQSSDMQQSTRVGFGKLVSDVRLAGFDFDRDGIPFGSIAPLWKPGTSYVPGNRVQPSIPNGHTYACTAGGTSSATPPTWNDASGATVTEVAPSTVVWKEAGSIQYQQPDEQIEYAGTAAIVLRANFNYDVSSDQCPPPGDPAVPCENGREVDLESDAIQVVTTRNSEIVAYALVSQSGNSLANKDKIVFYADVKDERHVYPGSSDPDEDKVEISGVDLTSNYPPYTLYRYTVNDDGTPTAGMPIAEDIRSLRFRYFNDTGGTDKAEIGCGDPDPDVCAAETVPNGEGAYDADDSSVEIPERDLRSSIKSIRIELLGMSPDPDRDYTDPSDTVAPRHRKFLLETLVVPRNLGKRGMKEFSTELPGKPTLNTACVGSCNAIYLTWSPPTGFSGDVDSYNILYEQGPCGANPTYVHAEDAGNNLEGYATLFVVPGNDYRVSVQAVNKFGSATADQCLEVSVLNTTKPDKPADLKASGGDDPDYAKVANQIDLYWPPTTTNATTTTSCQPAGTKEEVEIPWAENIYYQIWRSTKIDFDPTDGTPDEVKILDYNISQQPVDAGGMLKWSDTTVGNCLPFYYRIQTIDACIQNSAMNEGGDIEIAQSGIFPAIGTDAIKGEALSTQTPAVPANLSVSAQNPSPPLGLTDVTIAWTAVTTDDGGEPMNVSRYLLEAKNTSGGSDVSTTAYTSSGNLQLDAGQTYDITATAVDCNSSNPSTALPWPCNWIAGNPSIAMSQIYGGSGTLVDPYIIETPTTLSVTFTSNISKVEFTTYAPDDTVIDGPVTDSGPKTTFAYSIPNPPDGVVARIRILATSLDGKCTLSPNVYVLDEPPPPCELLDDATDPTVVTFSSGTAVVNATLKNSSVTDDLDLKKVIVTWSKTDAAGGTALSSITVPREGGGTSTVTTSCGPNDTTVKADFSSLTPATITAGTTSYPITITFNKNQSNFIVTGVCIIYQAPGGDLKQCTVYPSAGSCSEPAGTCQ
ncbi:MAG TPA: hypothetical protein VNA69_17315 [Thermoanaerobaculia bacterium]|nr:hypothetical protein [Thermoanaerobaculia bacterium]